MNEPKIAFLIWLAVSALIAGIGVSALRNRTKAVGFFANSKVPEVRDIPSYNKAVGKLFLCFALTMAACGSFLLHSNTVVSLLVPVLGTVFSVLITIVIYTSILPKYEK